MAYGRIMIFIETAVFTRQITALVNDDDYADFQCELANDPEAGDVIPGTGGLRRSAWPPKAMASAAAPG